MIDKVLEKCWGSKKIGIIGRGIGLIYVDKLEWIGIWMIDLVNLDRLKE